MVQSIWKVSDTERKIRIGNGASTGAAQRSGTRTVRTLLGFYGFLILTGALGFGLMPVTTAGPLPVPDALFMAVSAVTLTGLSTVPVSGLVPLGQWMVLLLVQAGGIGVLYFASRLLLLPGHAFSREHHVAVQERWSEVNELTPARLLRNIIAGVLVVEALGALVLFQLFRSTDTGNPAFTAVFHAVSALGNAGFSTFGAEATGTLTVAPIAATMSVLVLLGGIGYVVLSELVRRASGRMERWSLNVPAALIGTFAIIAGGTTLYLLVDRGSGTGFWTALLRTINARTAGFAVIDPAQASPVSRILSMVLMFVGGAAGSVTGGVKITAALILFLSAWKGFRPDQPIVLFRRRITEATRNCAVVFVLRAMMMASFAVFLLAIAESWSNPVSGFAFGDLAFEAVSAFTTAGLSTGITPLLSPAGKLVLILTMAAGRIGLLLLVARMGCGTAAKKAGTAHPVYPEGEVLLG